MAEEPQFFLHIMVAAPFQLVLPVDPRITTDELRRLVERELSRSFGFQDVCVRALQDPNHNDLPRADCRVGLLLRNMDKVYVVLERGLGKRPRQFTFSDAPQHPPPPLSPLAPPTPPAVQSQPGSVAGSAASARSDAERIVAASFHTYFSLREQTMSPNSASRLKLELEARGPSSAEQAISEASIVVERVQRILAAAASSAPPVAEALRALQSLPPEQKAVLPQLGRALVSELMGTAAPIPVRAGPPSCRTPPRMVDTDSEEVEADNSSQSTVRSPGVWPGAASGPTPGRAGHVGGGSDQGKAFKGARLGQRARVSARP
jgi:hypothetical protein